MVRPMLLHQQCILCVSLWHARWLSPAKVIALLRHKYSTSHTKNRQRLLFSSQKSGLDDDSCFGSKWLSLYHLFTNNNNCIENALTRWSRRQRDDRGVQSENDRRRGSIGSTYTLLVNKLCIPPNMGEKRRQKNIQPYFFSLWRLLSVLTNEAHKRISVGF